MTAAVPPLPQLMQMVGFGLSGSGLELCIGSPENLLKQEIKIRVRPPLNKYATAHFYWVYWEKPLVPVTGNKFKFSDVSLVLLIWFC